MYKNLGNSTSSFALTFIIVLFFSLCEMVEHLNNSLDNTLSLGDHKSF